MVTFRPYEPDQQLLLPPSLREWLGPDHLEAHHGPQLAIGDQCP